MNVATSTLLYKIRMAPILQLKKKLNQQHCIAWVIASHDMDQKGLQVSKTEKMGFNFAENYNSRIILEISVKLKGRTCFYWLYDVNNAWIY